MEMPASRLKGEGIGGLIGPSTSMGAFGIADRREAAKAMERALAEPDS